ncbi:MAG: hypothetical protein WC325_10595 [Candidatus Bathyarchaeia archaeon]|jgi:transposase-like protein
MKEITNLNCPECKSTHIVKAGFAITRKGRKQKYKCQTCARTFYQTQEEANKP